MSKPARRADVIARRAAHVRAPATDAVIVERLAAIREIAQSRRLGLYRALAGEPDIASLGDKVAAEVYLPVVVGSGRPLEFGRFEPGDRLVRSSFGIDEPGPSAPRIDPYDLDAVVVPAVAIDTRGTRLGHGAGFYDRTFARAPRPLLVGVLYDFALIERIDADPWDVAVEVVVTEARVIRPALG